MDNSIDSSGRKSVSEVTDANDVFYGNGFVASDLLTNPACGEMLGMIEDEE